MNSAAAPTIATAAKSDFFTAVATIAGGKAHRVTARTLLEPVTFTEKRNSWSPPTTVTLEAGEVLYYGTECGTIRNAGNGWSYGNTYRAADEVTCSKCKGGE